MWGADIKEDIRGRLLTKQGSRNPHSFGWIDKSEGLRRRSDH
jgi:hypothetical protein